VQRDLESAGHREEIDIFRVMAQAAQLGDETLPALVNDVSMPAGLNKGDTSRMHRRGNSIWGKHETTPVFR
jgi:hypothetical protein